MSGRGGRSRESLVLESLQLKYGRRGEQDDSQGGTDPTDNLDSTTPPGSPRSSTSSPSSFPASLKFFRQLSASALSGSRLSQQEVTAPSDPSSLTDNPILGLQEARKSQLTNFAHRQAKQTRSRLASRASSDVPASEVPVPSSSQTRGMLASAAVSALGAMKARKKFTDSVVRSRGKTVTIAVDDPTFVAPPESRGVRQRASVAASSWASDRPTALLSSAPDDDNAVKEDFAEDDGDESGDPAGGEDDDDDGSGADDPPDASLPSSILSTDAPAPRQSVSVQPKRPSARPHARAGAISTVTGEPVIFAVEQLYGGKGDFHHRAMRTAAVYGALVLPYLLGYGCVGDGVGANPVEAKTWGFPREPHLGNLFFTTPVVDCCFILDTIVFMWSSFMLDTRRRNYNEKQAGKIANDASGAYEVEKAQLAITAFRCQCGIWLTLCIFNSLSFPLLFGYETAIDPRSDAAFTLIFLQVAARLFSAFSHDKGRKAMKTIKKGQGNYFSKKTRSLLKKLLTNAILLFLMLHSLCCAWSAICISNCLDGNACWFDYKIDESFGMTKSFWKDSKVSRIYSLSLYSTTAMFVGGNGMDPVNDFEMIFSWMCLLAGAIFTAIFYGQTISLIHSLNIKHIEFTQKIEAVEDTMENLRLPRKLRERIMSYYNYCWYRYSSFSNHGTREFLSELSPPLSLDVQLICHSNVIGNIPFFENCELSVLQSIMQNIQQEIFLPGDYVFHVQDEATNLYMVKAGVVDILGNSRQVFKTLGPGTYFGEVALINSHGRRSASAICRTYCTCDTLSKDAFDVIVKKHPSFFRTVLAVCKEKNYTYHTTDQELGEEVTAENLTSSGSKGGANSDGGGGGRLAMSADDLRKVIREEVQLAMSLLKEDLAGPSSVPATLVGPSEGLGDEE